LEVLHSIWTVVDATNQCSCQKKLPSSHQHQMEMAREFQEDSQAGFNCCVAAMDGLLIWISKPCIDDVTIFVWGQ